MEHDFLFAKNDISSLSKLIGLFLPESTLYVRVTSFSLYETWIFCLLTMIYHLYLKSLDSSYEKALFMSKRYLCPSHEIEHLQTFFLANFSLCYSG